jgi:hypothetical protein
MSAKYAIRNTNWRVQGFEHLFAWARQFFNNPMNVILSRRQYFLFSFKLFESKNYGDISFLRIGTGVGGPESISPLIPELFPSPKVHSFLQ